MMQPCHKEIYMPHLLRFERAARYLFGILASCLLLALLASQLGWIRRQPAYDAFGWYTVMQHEQVQFIRQVDSEAACRSREHAPDVLCRQGKNLNSAWIADR